MRDKNFTRKLNSYCNIYISRHIHHKNPCKSIFYGVKALIKRYSKILDVEMGEGRGENYISIKKSALKMINFLN